MSICAEVLRLTLELSFISEPEDIKDKWNHIAEHASGCETCALALEAFTKGTNTKARTGAIANWDVDPLEFRYKLDTSLSGLATQFNELSLELEADKVTKLKEGIEQEVAALPLTRESIFYCFCYGHLASVELWAKVSRV